MNNGEAYANAFAANLKRRGLLSAAVNPRPTKRERAMLRRAKHDAMKRAQQWGVSERAWA